MGKSESLIFVMNLAGDLVHSQNILGSKLDQDLSSHYFPEDTTSSISSILLTNKLFSHSEPLRVILGEI